MPTIMVDPDDQALWVERESIPGIRRKPIRERLNEPMPPEAVCYVLDGRPHLLFSQWDYAEDWSGDYVREVHPYAVAFGGGNEIGEAEWRKMLTLR